jgi:hypothetical protein
MAESLVHFDNGIQRQIIAQQRQNNSAQAQTMDELASSVVAQGGHCDPLVFMTSFWGGPLVSDTGWASKRINEAMMVSNPSQEAVNIFTAAQDVSYSLGCPYLFVKEGTTPDADEIGVIIPDVSNLAVHSLRYNIALDSDNDRTYVGTIDFLSLFIERTGSNQRNLKKKTASEKYPLATVRRSIGSTVVEIEDDAEGLLIGEPSIRKAFGYDRARYHHNDEVEERMRLLRRAAERRIAIRAK